MTLDMDNVDAGVEELLEDVFVNSSVSSTKANFKGEFNSVSNLHNIKILLRRSKDLPKNNKIAHLSNQLLWITPDGEDPILMWCDPGGQLYKLKFYPHVVPLIKP